MAEHKVTLLALAAVATLAAVLISFPDTRPQTDSALRIGYAIERPYAYINQQGELTGASIESAAKIAKQLHTDNIEWVQLRFDKLLTSLRQGHIDVIGSGMYQTPEREKHFDFSLPFLEADSAIMLRRASSSANGNIDNKPATTIAVQAGSVEAERLESTSSSHNLTALKVPHPKTGLEALQTGLSDGLYLSKPSLEAIQRRQQQNYDIVPESQLIGQFKQLNIGFVFNREDELLKQWNEASKHWLGSDEHIQLISRFGFSQDNLP